MMEKETPRGRPKGAKNIERPIAIAIPAACPQAQGGCGSTDAEILRIATVIDHAGILPNGQEYDRITVKRVRCRACGVHYLIRLYERTLKKE